MPVVDVEVRAGAARAEARPGRVQGVVVGEDLDPPIRRVADDLAFAGSDDGRLAHPTSLRRLTACPTSDAVVTMSATQILEIVNAAAVAYRGVIPADCWHEPYMASSELETEIAAGVRFWGFEADGELVGAIGIQPVHAST